MAQQRSRSRSPLLILRSNQEGVSEAKEDDLRDELHERRFRRMESERLFQNQISFHQERYQLLAQSTQEHVTRDCTNEIMNSYKRENIDLHRKLGEANAKLLKEYNSHLEQLSRIESKSLKMEKEHNTEFEFLEGKIKEYRQTIDENILKQDELEEKVSKLEKEKFQSDNHVKLLSKDSEEFSGFISHEELKKDISEKEEFIANLACMVDDLQQELEFASSNQEKNIPDTEVDNLKKELEISKSSIESMEKKISEFNNAHNRLTLENEKLKREVLDKSSKIEHCDKKYQESLSVLKSENESFKSENKKLNDDILAKTEEVSELNAKLQSLKEISTKLESNLKDQINKLEGTCSNYKTQNTFLSSDKEALKSKLNEEEDKNRSLQKSISQLNAKILESSESFKRQLKEIRDDKNSLAEKLKNLQDNSKSLEKSQNFDWVTYQKRISELEGENKVLCNKVKDYENLKAQSGAFEVLIENSKKENQESLAEIQKLKETLAKNDKEAAKMKSRIDEKDTKIKKLARDNSKYCDDVKNLKKEIDNLKTKYSKQRSSRSKSRDLSNCELKLKEKDEEVEKLSKEFLIKEGRIAELTKQVDELKNELSKSGKDRKDSRSQSPTTSSKSSDTETVIQKKDEEMEKMAKEFLANMKQLDSFRKQVNDLMNDKVDKEKKLKDISEEASKKEKALWNELNKCREDQGKLQSQNVNLEERLRNDRKELSKQIEESQEYIKQILKLKKEKSDLHDVARFTTKNIKELQSENSDLKAKLANLEQALDSEKAKVSDRPEAKNNGEIIRLNELVSEKDNEIFAIMSEKANLVREIENLKRNN